MQRERIAERQPARITVASYATYLEAQRAVDYLADQDFPVARVAIVAEGIRIVEQVTGKLSYGRVAANGALSGAFVGALIGLLFGLFDWTAPFVSVLNLAVWGLVIGALAGMLLSLLTYAMSGGQRDFASVSGMQAERYNLQVDPEVADRANSMLGQMPSLQG